MYHHVCAQVNPKEVPEAWQCHICLTPTEEMCDEEKEMKKKFTKRQAQIRKVHSAGRRERDNLVLRKLDVFAPFISKIKLAKLQASATSNKKALEEDELSMIENMKEHCTSSEPSYITATLRPYQVEGVNWLISSYDCGMGCILGKYSYHIQAMILNCEQICEPGDQMGLGKTLQTLTLLAFLKKMRASGGPHLVIAPLAGEEALCDSILAMLCFMFRSCSRVISGY